MTLLPRLFLGAALLLAAPAQAASPTGRVLAAGGITLGGELVGAAVGGLGGIYLGGGAACASSNDSDRSAKCTSDLIVGGVLGTAAGLVAGGLGGAALGAKATQTPVGRSVGLAALGLGTGVVVGGLLSATDVEPLADAGSIIFLLGMPVGAGVAVATIDAGPISDLTLSSTGRGLSLSGRF